MTFRRATQGKTFQLLIKMMLMILGHLREKYEEPLPKARLNAFDRYRKIKIRKLYVIDKSKGRCSFLSNEFPQ